MANRIVSVHAGIYGMGIYAIMMPSSGFSVAHWFIRVAAEIQYTVNVSMYDNIGFTFSIKQWYF